MRDSQSLLEQLLSFAGDKITVDAVHGMLGTARVGRLQAITEALIEQNAAAALTQLDAAIGEGVDVGQLAEQLLGYLRDCMAAAVGCEPTALLHVGPSEFDQAKTLGESWGVATTLSAAQILDQSIARMRQSLQRRTLVEMALVRISQLEQLSDLGSLISQLESGQPSPKSGRQTGSKAAKKKRTDDSRRATAPRQELTAPSEPTSIADGASAGNQEVRPTVSDADAEQESTPAIPSTDDPVEAWRAALATLEGLEADIAAQFERCELKHDRMLVTFTNKINADRCARPTTQEPLRKAISTALGRDIQLDFAVTEAQQSTPAPRKKNARELIRESQEHPLVKQAVELFDAEVTRVLR